MASRPRCSGGRFHAMPSAVATPDAPLAGRRIVVTRPEGGGDLAQRLLALGATVHEIPATRIEPLSQLTLRAALGDLARYAWIIFTSRNAVTLVLDQWEAMGHAVGAFGAAHGLKIAAVGSATADALRQRGLAVTVVPSKFAAEGVLEAMTWRDDVAGTDILYATAEGARQVLASGLSAAGATVHVIPIYRSIPDERASLLLRAAVDAGCDLVTFTAASTARAWVSAIGARRAGLVPAASIGPVTSEAARALGVPVAAEADPSTAEGLVQAIVRYFT
jgi:uroporphyrinogen-III synthase